MSVDIRSSDRRRYMNELQAREKEIAAGLLKTAPASPPQVVPENEKRVRREIANSNERRRMQCINAGFSNLRALIPHTDGEKLSKAAILQHASEYICSLEKEKGRLQQQLDHTQGLLSGLGHDRPVNDAYVSSSPPPSKRKKRDTESSDEGVCSLSDASEDSGSELQQENLALRHQLELELQRYTVLEQHNRLLEAQFLTLVHSQASHVSAIGEMQPTSLEQRSLHVIESVYDRQVISQEVSGHTYTARHEHFNSPRAMSPSLQQRVSSQTSEPLVAASSQVAVIDSCDQREDSVTSMATEAVSTTETRLLADTTSTSTTSTTDQHSYHQHNYCHRDHPRRRHRQQTQLQQQREEEELRRRQEDRTVHEQMMYQRSHNTQNLEKLVEAIRQIEGDRMLSKFNEDEHKHLDTEQSMPSVDDSEREVSSDQDEPRSESSGRDSPLHHHHHHHLHQHMSTFSSSNVSEKYPVASTLLHCPVSSSSHRPGEMQPTSLEQRSLHVIESVYDRQVISQEVSGHTYTARHEHFNSPRAMSPSLQQRVSSQTSEPLVAASSQVAVIDSCDQREDSVTSMATEAVSTTETRLLADTTSTSTTSTTTDQHSYYQHNYCHRDHPRRRHRQQTQLQQQREEEELRRRQEDRTVHEQMMYQRSHNTQNLEKLVEVIRQIEGDRMLSKFNEDEHKHLDTEQSMPSVDDSEREVSSDQDEPRSESSGRDSPLHHHHHHHLQQHMSTFSSSNVSEKYPVASTLLHCPVSSSSHRPGVIVHKL